MPSFLHPIRPRVTSMWRLFTVAMHSSLVSSIFTGLRIFLASRTVNIMKLLIHQLPKELPDGSAQMRILLSGIPKASCTPSRTSDGVCEEVHTVTLSPGPFRNTRIPPQGSHLLTLELYVAIDEDIRLFQALVQIAPLDDVRVADISFFP